MSSTLTYENSKLAYMNTLQDRIAEVMTVAGLTVGELADIAGVTSSAATQWKDGPTKTLKAAPAAKLSAKTGFSALWLSSGEGPKMVPGGVPQPVRSNVADAPALASSRLVPVVGHVKGGTDGYLDEMQFPTGYGEGFVEFWTKDSAAYALRVKGDSMHPRYRAGEFIVVTPSIEAQPGRDVVVKLKDGRKLLKLLNWVRGDEIQLLSINDGYAPTTLSVDEVESIHRVAGGVPQDAFQEARSH
jgi:phage repressor protein C with HTH and peptisase S24 domain